MLLSSGRSAARAPDMELGARGREAVMLLNKQFRPQRANVFVYKAVWIFRRYVFSYVGRCMNDLCIGNDFKM